MTDSAKLEERLGHRFAKCELLTEALTHRSVLHETSASKSGAAPRLDVDNQRLEFFGDAVLQLVLTELVYARFPKADEGHLTKLRARMANRHMLYHLARLLGLGEFLVLGKGEETSGGRQRPSNLADAYEAVIGALYLDGGYEVASRFVLAQMQEELDRIEITAGGDNPKGLLQEMLQANSSRNPVYRVISEAGPDHDKRFESVVEFGGEELGRGIGGSKKEAEMKAAQDAIDKLAAKTE